MSSTTDVQTINQITRIYTLALYFVILSSGVIGNLLNIFVFSTLKVFRRNQCAFYLITAAIADFFLLIVVLPFRIAQFSFGYDPMVLSLAWCKIRQTIVPQLSLMSFSVVCFIAIDQYLSTHCIPWIRQLSSLQLARRLVCIAVVIWALYGIPFLIYFEIRPTFGCTVYDVGFSRFYSFVHFCVFSGILPIMVSGCSATLAYLNVRRIVRHQIPVFRRRLDRQLTAMILARVAFLVVMTTPFVTFRIYTFNEPAVDPNDTLHLAIEQLVLSITTSFFYINSAGPFYVFIFVSKRFRVQVKHAITKNVWKKLCNCLTNSHALHNQVAPASESSDPDLE